MRVLLTRPLADSRDVARALVADDVECLIWPLTRIVPVAGAIDIPPGTGGLLFTSANGVRAFAALAPRRDLPALCVGEASAEAARRAGFADVRTAGGDARALARLAEASGIGRFLHPRGRHAAGGLAGWLAGSGRQVAEAVLYEAVEAGPAPATIAAALARGAVGMVTAWSPRAAAILARRLPGLAAELAATDLLAISAGAARPLAGAGFRRSLVAARPDGRSMLAAIRASGRTRE